MRLPLLLSDAVGLALTQVFLHRASNRALVRKLLSDRALCVEGSADLLCGTADGTLSCKAR